MNEANTLEEITGAGTFPRDPRLSPPTSSAFAQLKTSIRVDPAYAWSWQCNVAMAILDNCHGQLTHRQANEIAAGVMLQLFDVDVRASVEWGITEPNWNGGFAPNGEG